MDASEDHQRNPAGRANPAEDQTNAAGDQASLAGDHASPAGGRLRPLLHVGTRAVALTVRPVMPVVEAAAEAGLGLERRAVDRLLESDEIERVLTAAVNSPQIQASVDAALSSGAANRLIDGLFDSGLLDRFLDRLLASPALWHLVDEIATSPAVMAAISQQGLGFADQVGDQVRDRSRKADDWVERAARRLAHRSPRPLSPEPGTGM